MWDLIVSVPDHCLSFYFRFRFNKLSNQMIEMIYPEKQFCTHGSFRACIYT